MPVLMTYYRSVDNIGCVFLSESVNSARQILTRFITRSAKKTARVGMGHTIRRVAAVAYGYCLYVMAERTLFL